MATLDLTMAFMQNLITHKVGNKLRDENYILSNEETHISDETKEYLLKYFLTPLKSEEFYAFTHPLKLELNEVFAVVTELFNDTNNFIKLSQDLAKLLYEQTMHPKIKEGELNIAYFTDVSIDEEEVDAIGIFKSEINVPYLKMFHQQKKCSIETEFGFEIKGTDKGCFIFNAEKENGYKILIIDSSKKAEEAQYWKDDFLHLKSINNDFLQTKQFLNIAKEFVANKISDEFEISKTDRIDLLNRSIEYFRHTDNFDKKEFESTVFVDNDLIQSFNNFGKQYKEENNIEIGDRFEISTTAVKKQARIFKSVLKLDSNFHVYIHGDRDWIEQGVDKDGRKFYKLYFENEE